jgi:hypothetical protein
VRFPDVSPVAPRLDDNYEDLEEDETDDFVPKQHAGNILADVERTGSSSKKNLLSREESGPQSRNQYIRQPQDQFSAVTPGVEVIMYPSGQLLGRGQTGGLVSSTVSPQLASVLSNTYYASHFLPTSIRRNEADPDEIVYDHPADSTDYDEPEVEKRRDDSRLGIIPRLIRTAKDDLKLVGNVIKLALS